MKKSILNLGKALNKAEQKSINGGTPLMRFDPFCDGAHDGNSFYGCQCPGSDGAVCMTNIYTGQGWVPRSGSCEGGSCNA